MMQLKYEPNALKAARFQAEARLMLAKRAGRQGRLLDIAAAKGRDLEPVGRMAG